MGCSWGPGVGGTKGGSLRWAWAEGLGEGGGAMAQGERFGPLSLLKAGTMACGDLGTVVAASPEAGPSLLLLRGVCQGNTELPGSI